MTERAGYSQGELTRLATGCDAAEATVPDLRHPVRWAEWLGQRLAMVMRAPSRCGRRLPWRRHYAYLRALRQRHRVRWRLVASGLAGLHLVSCPMEGARSALLLLASRRADHSFAELAGQADVRR